MMKDLISILIALAALCVSGIVAFANVRDKLEKRHGEISKLRSDSLEKLSRIYHRTLSSQLHTEAARLELRRLPDSAAKYEEIESMPSQIVEARGTVLDVVSLREKIEKIDPQKLNKSYVLMTFQSVDHDLRALEEKATRLEARTLQYLESVRAQQEAADAPEVKRVVAPTSPNDTGAVVARLK
jgi:hypothetical protein